MRNQTAKLASELADDPQAEIRVLNQKISNRDLPLICWRNGNDDEWECVKFERKIRELEEALKLIKENSLNPAHTMTKLGLEESLDMVHKIAVNLLKKGRQ